MTECTHTKYLGCPPCSCDIRNAQKYAKLDNMETTIEMITVPADDYHRLVSIALAAEGFLRSQSADTLSDLHESIYGGAHLID